MNRARALAMLSAAAALSPSGALAQQSSRKLRVGVNGGESLSEGLLAEAGGFLSRAGFDVELVTVTNGGAMTTGIIAGAIDVGPSNIASISSAHIRGLELNLFAPSVVVSSSMPPTTVIAVPKDSTLRVAKDFTGRTIALSTLRDLQQAAVMTWLDANGCDSKSVSFIEIPTGAQVAALHQNRVDAAVLVEPYLSPAKSETRWVGRPYDSLGSQLMTFGWIANKDWYAANAAVIQKLALAIRATAIWANRNHDATAAIISRASQIPEDAFRTMTRQVFSESSLDAAMIQPIIDASARYGFFPHSFAAGELFAKG
jgi:NitT/TauT family transport system substrate-binding protein